MNYDNSLLIYTVNDYMIWNISKGVFSSTLWGEG